jgi:hypothetical protein
MLISLSGDILSDKAYLYLIDTQPSSIRWHATQTSGHKVPMMFAPNLKCNDETEQEAAYK